MRVWHALVVEGGDRVDWSPGIGLAWVCFLYEQAVLGCAFGNKRIVCLRWMYCVKVVEIPQFAQIAQ